MVNRILLVLTLLVAVVGVETARAQEEATMTLSATVLPSGAAGSSIGLVEAAPDVGISENVQSSQTEDDAAVVEDDQPPAQQENLDAPGQEEGVQESISREPTQKQLWLRGLNQVLVEVQTPSGTAREIVSFSGSVTKRVNVGTLEEATTVDIIHLSL